MLHGVITPSVTTPSVDIRRRIWELTHQVYHTYATQWPYTWARPIFACDPFNPTFEEWAPCAEQFFKSAGCKSTLEKWRDDVQTTQSTRDALTELVQLLSVYAEKLRKKRDAGRATVHM